MRKVFYWISTILQVILLIATVGVQELSMKKMGMMRYVVFINQQWQAQYPIATIRYISIAVLTVLSVIIILYALKKKGHYRFSNKTLSMLIAEVILTLVFISFTLIFSTESYRSYYFIIIMLGIVVLIQNLKTIVHLNR